MATVVEVGAWVAEKDAALLKRLACEIVSFEEAKCIIRMIVEPNMANSNNVCQGGFIFSLADQACANACMSLNNAGATLSADITFTNPAFIGDVLTATAVMTIDKGRVAMCDVDVINQDDVPIAQFRGITYRINKRVIPEE